MTNKTKTARPRRSFWRNIRGDSGTTQAVILIALLGVAAIGAVRALGGQINTSMQKQGGEIQKL